jgi:rhamnosyltransferase
MTLWPSSAVTDRGPMQPEGRIRRRMQPANSKLLTRNGAASSTVLVQTAETDTPSVAVLMATRNGSRWLERQLETVLAQQNVSVRIYVSDDGSRDGTGQQLQKLSEDPRIMVLPPSQQQLGGAGANFQRLIRDVGGADFDYFAFCDQDDEWMPDRLFVATQCLADQGADGFSSSVTSFWPDGRESVIYNAHRATKWDYFGGGAGQGCSFVLSRRGMAWVRHVLLAHSEQCLRIHYHDWLTYALIRARGWQWVFHADPTLRYRQHDGNEIGSRGSLSALRLRHQRIVSGWYADQLHMLAELVATVIPGHPGAQEVLTMLAAGGLLARVAMIGTAMSMRRPRLDRFMFLAYYLAGYLHRETNSVRPRTEPPAMRG